jgi:hypothetical protein
MFDALKSSVRGDEIWGPGVHPPLTGLPTLFLQDNRGETAKNGWTLFVKKKKKEEKKGRKCMYPFSPALYGLLGLRSSVLYYCIYHESFRMHWDSI